MDLASVRGIEMIREGDANAGTRTLAITPRSTHALVSQTFIGGAS
jgi:hypothetical protein